MPTLALSFAAGSAARPYFLLAWTAHLLTAVLLCRIVSLLGEDPRTGLAAGAIYAVFPACNGALLWPIGTSFYYMQALGFVGWFYLTWKKLVIRRDYRYRWRDLALLSPVAFSGEQILPAIVLLLPITYWLWAGREELRRFLRFWSLHAAATAAPLGHGAAPSFITGNRWSLNSMLALYTGADHVQGARDLVIDERGELALHNRHSFRQFRREQVSHLRIFVRDPENRFVPRSLLALSVSEGRFQLLPLPAFTGRRVPSEALSLEELKQQPFFGEIYLVRRISSRMEPADL